MEITFHLEGTHAADTPMIFPVVLIVVNFLEVVGEVALVVVAGDAGATGLWKINGGALLTTIDHL